MVIRKTKVNRSAAVRLDELMTVNEAAETRGVTRAAIWDLIRRGRLERIDRFGRTLVYRSEIKNYKPGRGGRPAKSQGRK